MIINQYENYTFPLLLRVDSYLKRPGRYNDGRNKNHSGSYQRRHAGCDLYAPAGSVVISVGDGIIIQNAYKFYGGTYALEVDYGEFVCRYGEIDKEVPPHIKSGKSVTKGQIIGRVGKIDGGIQSMLHFEMYTGKETGPLTNKKNPPFQRRLDLMDPTDFLNKVKDGELKISFMWELKDEIK